MTHPKRKPPKQGKANCITPYDRLREEGLSAEQRSAQISEMRRQYEREYTAFVKEYGEVVAKEALRIAEKQHARDTASAVQGQLNILSSLKKKTRVLQESLERKDTVAQEASLRLDDTLAKLDKSLRRVLDESSKVAAKGRDTSLL